MNETTIYQERKPSKDLTTLIHSFWTHSNISEEVKEMSIIPDSYFKIIIVIENGKITKYFMTGLWTAEKVFCVPPKATVFGCRLRILAPEFLINEEITTILNSVKQLDLSYLNIEQFDFSNFDNLVKQWQNELLKIKPSKTIHGNKLRLSQVIYEAKGSISATELSTQIFWSNRQINRYLNKYIGISLKKYLNIQKCYQSYVQIREGEFFPKKNYFDQAHFIREVKKHTGETPKSLYEQQNDRFIQLKGITQE